MKIELMIYTYIAICISMIAYNIVYIFILRHREKALTSDSEQLKKRIAHQLETEMVDEKHQRFLRKKLQRTNYITAFDKALEQLYQERPEAVGRYLSRYFSVFVYLTEKYLTKDTLKIAYFPYLLHKYEILRYGEPESVTEMLYDLLRSVNIYCRENTLKALYSLQDAEVVVRALQIMDKNLSFHHPKLICDGLMEFHGDKDALKDALLRTFEGYSVEMRLNITNYFRFGNIRCDELMESLLTDEKADAELRYSAIRYFEKFPSESVREFLQQLAENKEGRNWEYQAIASSALKSYPGDVTFRILVQNLSNRQWHVRQNSAISCEKLGYTYHDLLQVFDGNDRYAREIMRYRLDRKRSEETAVKS